MQKICDQIFIGNQHFGFGVEVQHSVSESSENDVSLCLQVCSRNSSVPDENAL
jgi:hypothetical protein